MGVDFDVFLCPPVLLVVCGVSRERQPREEQREERVEGEKEKEVEEEQKVPLCLCSPSRPQLLISVQLT